MAANVMLTLGQERTGTIAISLPSTAMDCAALWLFMTSRTPTRPSTMLMTVRIVRCVGILRADPDVFTESTIITLADWYHTAARLGGRRPDSTLINGLGRYFGNPTSELAVINVTPGKRCVAALLG